jgi:NAD(P)H-nitrite reductase large subunit
MARRHLLIGSGPAAIVAAQTIRGQDAGAEIVILGAEASGYYSRPGLAYYLAKEIPEEGIFPFTAKDFARLGIQLLHKRAAAVDPAGHRVTLESGQDLYYDRLLMATGSLAIPVGVPGADLDGVTKLDDMDDTRDLIRRSRKAKAAVVVGGGITALEIVEGLAVRRVKVHYFVRKERYWSNVLSESESHIVEVGLRDRGVEIHYFTELAQIVGKNGRVVAVGTEDGKQIPCDIVGVAIGVLPQKELAEAAGLECGRGILVDRQLRSSHEDIFAAGDLAEVHDPATDQRTLEVLWSTAVAKGRVAGLNMAADPVHVYDPGTPVNVTRLAGYKITIIGTVGSAGDPGEKGVSRGASETFRRPGPGSVVESQMGNTHIRLALGERTIAGAVIMGDQALSFPLQDIIGAKADVSSIMAGLLGPAAPIAELVDGFWQDWKAQLA